MSSDKLKEKEQLFKIAMEATKQKTAQFVDDVIAEMPCGKSKFYELFPAASEEMEAIKDALWKNKTAIKRAMRKNWFKDKNSTTQMALYKLLANDDERRALSMTYIQGDVQIEETTGLTKAEKKARLLEIFADADKR